MDTTFKAGAYTDVPGGSLEKGSPTVQTLHPYATPPERTRGHRSLAKRLSMIALGTVALTWLVFSYGQRIFYDQSQWFDEAMWHVPLADESLHECVGNANWTVYYDEPPWSPDYPHGAEATFSLPLDSDALFLISRGPLQQGEVNIEQSTQVADTVDVRVRVAYFDEYLLKVATVCQLEREDKEHGVGIFTPPRPPRKPHHGLRSELEFDITVTLPAGNEEPLLVKKLETKLPNYDQKIADLGESVLFDQISLMSANGELSVQSVTSKFGQFSTLNGAIDGYFNASSFLDIHLANGRIAPEVNLLHREGSEPVELLIRTINGEIDAEISLASDAETGGEFEIDAQATHGEVVLTFTDSPVDSVLHCRAETTIGGVEVELDSAFEGAYSLENVLGNKIVSQHDVGDPAGKDRRRVVTVHEARGRVEGELKWVDSDGNSSESEGYVVLKSILSPIELVV